MAPRGLQEFLQGYEAQYPGDVVHVEKPIDHRWEIPALLVKLEKLNRFPLAVFHNVLTRDGTRSPFPLVYNVYADRQRCARIIGSTVDEYSLEFARRAKEQKTAPVVVGKEHAPVKEVIHGAGEFDLTCLPAPVHHSYDPGPYLTAGFFTTVDPDSGVSNSALHRGWLKERDEIRVYLDYHTHNGENLLRHEKLGRDMRAAYWIGHDPAVCLGTQTPTSYPGSHFDIAGGIIGEPIRLVPSESLGDDFLVPADAEIVIEGLMHPGERQQEGPFGEGWGYTGPMRTNPVLHVTAVTHRTNAYLHGIMIGHADQMAGISPIFVEASVAEAVRLAVPNVVRIVRPPWAMTQIYIVIKKTGEGQAKEALLTALGRSNKVKQAFVFDEDVNVFDPQEVLWAIGTRLSMDDGLVVATKCRSTSLDPFTPDKEYVTKWGMDCTKPLDLNFPERSTIPQDVMSRVKLEDYVG